MACGRAWLWRQFTPPLTTYFGHTEDLPVCRKFIAVQWNYTVPGISMLWVRCWICTDCMLHIFSKHGRKLGKIGIPARQPVYFLTFTYAGLDLQGIQQCLLRMCIVDNGVPPWDLVCTCPWPYTDVKIDSRSPYATLLLPAADGLMMQGVVACTRMYRTEQYMSVHDHLGAVKPSNFRGSLPVTMVNQYGGLESWRYCNPGNFSKLINLVNWWFWRFISY